MPRNATNLSSELQLEIRRKIFDQLLNISGQQNANFENVRIWLQIIIQILGF